MRHRNDIAGVRTIAVSIMMAICLFASCDNSVVYHHYEHVPTDRAEDGTEGWNVRDSLTFHIDTIPENATYATLLCLRLNASYPYNNLATLVSQYTLPGTAAEAGSHPTLTRLTATIDAKRKDGTPGGKGLTCLTHEVPIAETTLRQGDSLRIVVRHRMRREIMPGVMDVGIKVVRVQ